MTKLLSSRLDEVVARLAKVKLPSQTRLKLEVASASVVQAKEEEPKKKKIDPDKYHAEHGRCPPGWHYDGDKCVEGDDPKGDKGKGAEDDEDKKKGAADGEAGSEGDIDPTADDDGDGVSDSARVGVKGDEVPPPPKVQRLPNLTEEERQIEARFADAFEKDPENLSSLYLRDVLEKAIAKGGPPEFVTDDAKLRSPDYNPKDADPATLGATRARRNYLVHQTANAIAKRAFVRHLDELAKLPEGHPKKAVLVTSGGTGSGKGFALKETPHAKAIKANVGGVWDAAGEQNATENPWIMEECRKRGIKPTFLWVDADPIRNWAHPEMGVMSRAALAPPKGEGRMVDAQLFADSYAIGAKNFKAFHEKHKDQADFIFLNTWKTNDKGFPEIEIAQGVDERSLTLDVEDLYGRATATINEKAPTEAIREGATIGQRIWGPPKSKKAKEAEAAGEGESSKLGEEKKEKAEVEASVVMAAKKKKDKEPKPGDLQKRRDEIAAELRDNFEANLSNLDKFYEDKAKDAAEVNQLVFDKDGTLKLPKKSSLKKTGKSKGKKKDGEEDDGEVKAMAERMDLLAAIIAEVGVPPRVQLLVEEAADAVTAATSAGFEGVSSYEDTLQEDGKSIEDMLATYGLPLTPGNDEVTDEQALAAYYDYEVKDNSCVGASVSFETWMDTASVGELMKAIQVGRDFLAPKLPLTAAASDDDMLYAFYRLTVGHPEGYDEWLGTVSDDDKAMIAKSMKHGL